MEAAAIPLPSPETTPPVMKMYFVMKIYPYTLEILRTIPKQPEFVYIAAPLRYICTRCIKQSRQLNILCKNVIFRAL